MLQRRLTLHQRGDLAVELFLVEQLAAGDAVDLTAKFCNSIFISELHLGLAPDQAGEHVIAEREIGAGRDRPHAHDHQSADDDPERDRSDADLTAAVYQRVVAAMAGLVVEVLGDSGGGFRGGRGAGRA